MALGKQYTAAQTYVYYTTLRVVCLKRRKRPPRAPGAASASTSRLPEPMRAASIRRDVLAATYKEQLVDEYCDAVGEERQQATPELVNAAVRLLHKVLLRDLRPPWADQAFPHPLPGDGLLSRYTRPGFLTWRGDSECLETFGNEVMEVFLKALARVDLPLAGYVARPLYACTQKSGQGDGGAELCMKVASMSRLVDAAGARAQYRCAACAKTGPPVSDSEPLRVLHVYALVDVGRVAMPVRTDPVRVVLRALPSRWTWGKEAGRPPKAETALPAWMWDRRGPYFKYAPEESEVIWRRSGPYEAAPVLLE